MQYAIKNVAIGNIIALIKAHVYCMHQSLSCQCFFAFYRILLIAIIIKINVLLTKEENLTNI